MNGRHARTIDPRGGAGLATEPFVRLLACVRIGEGGVAQKLGRDMPVEALPDLPHPTMDALEDELAPPGDEVPGIYVCHPLAEGARLLRAPHSSWATQLRPQRSLGRPRETVGRWRVSPRSPAAAARPGRAFVVGE